MANIDRKSSIDSEPRTLRTDQMQYAREAALYVVNTRSLEEALSIFTEGLESVGIQLRKNGNSMIELAGEVDYDYFETRPVQSPRDIVSAPF